LSNFFDLSYPSSIHFTPACEISNSSRPYLGQFFRADLASNSDRILTGKMLLVVIPMVRSACTHDDTLTNPITFVKRNVTSGETICLRDIPPRTSIIFKHFLQSKVEAFFSNGTSTHPSLDSRIVGYDSGDSISSLVITPTEDGKFSYFAVTLPIDCTTRIVSSQRLGVVTQTHTNGRFCYFNGAAQKVTYDIQFSANASGVLTSPDLGIVLSGTSHRRLPDVTASIIKWEGEVNFVAIGLLGDWRRGHPGIVRQIKESTPAFLELNGRELSWDRGNDEDDQALPPDRDPEPGEWDDDPEMSMILVVGQVVVVLVVVALFVRFIRSCGNQGQEPEHDAIPVIEEPALPDGPTPYYPELPAQH
jgi:hypothetical protein